MPGCITRCTNFRTSSINNAWIDIRYHFGPRTEDIGSELYIEDISGWNIFAAEKNLDPVTNVKIFGKWLIWKCSYGTDNLGNLATRIRDHEGISCIRCPFDSVDYDPVRSEAWLGYVPNNSELTDHGNFFMRVSQVGASWGFECTYDSCYYNLINGHRYFNV